jgi:hypothetical protein
LLAATGTVSAQFLETFDGAELRTDPSGAEGWSFFSGDGEAKIDLRGTDEGYATIIVDATHDRRNVWWAVIKRSVGGGLDLEKLSRPRWELRVEARIRSSHAPRRVNLHVNTQRTKDFHSHLMEFDIAEAGEWHTISMTTRGFPVQPGDNVNAQMALMDWGRGTYRVDVDYFKVDVVDLERMEPDLGDPLPYHPPIPDPRSFEHRVPAVESAVVGLSDPEVNLGEWSVLGSEVTQRILTVNSSMWVVLRWDLEQVADSRVAGNGLLELTTRSIQRDAREMKDFGLVRVVEILAGDPSWERESVTLSSLLAGDDLAAVFNPQPIIDWPVTTGEGAKTWLTISRPVLQRLIDGQVLGLAVIPLGSINVSFLAEGEQAPQLIFGVEKWGK